MNRLAIPKTHKLYIGGKFPRSESGRVYEVLSHKGDFLANAAKGSRKDARDAVKAAVMVEDVARTVHIARQGGELIPIPQAAIDSLFTRYQNVYGQAPQGALT